METFPFTSCLFRRKYKSLNKILTLSSVHKTERLQPRLWHNQPDLFAKITIKNNLSLFTDIQGRCSSLITAYNTWGSGWRALLFTKLMQHMGKWSVVGLDAPQIPSMWAILLKKFPVWKQTKPEDNPLMVGTRICRKHCIFMTSTN